MEAQQAEEKVWKPVTMREHRKKWEGLPEEQTAIVNARIKQRGLMERTIVMVGTSPDSCGLTPWGEEGVDEIWSLNDCHHLAFMEDHQSEIDMWFQMHHRWRFTRSNPRYGVNHWAWLKEEHDFPIYMQREYDDVPSSAEFPLRELSERYLMGRMGRGTNFQRKYFSSTFAFMFALALQQFEDKYRPSDYNPIHDGPYARIEMYGVELAQQEEYFLQRPNTEFWGGYLVGRGIQFYVPTMCRIFNGSMYGYRYPDLGGEIEKQMQKKAQEGKPVSMSKILKAVAGPDATEEDNVGMWDPYPDLYYRTGLEYPNGDSDLFLNDAEPIKELEDLVTA